jgi:hypothetical protein
VAEGDRHQDPSWPDRQVFTKDADWDFGLIQRVGRPRASFLA